MYVCQCICNCIFIYKDWHKRDSVRENSKYKYFKVSVYRIQNFYCFHGSKLAPLLFSPNWHPHYSFCISAYFRYPPLKRKDIYGQQFSNVEYL